MENNWLRILQKLTEIAYHLKCKVKNEKGRRTDLSCVAKVFEHTQLKTLTSK